MLAIEIISDTPFAPKVKLVAALIAVVPVESKLILVASISIVVASISKVWPEQFKTDCAEVAVSVFQ